MEQELRGIIQRDGSSFGLSSQAGYRGQEQPGITPWVFCPHLHSAFHWTEEMWVHEYWKILARSPQWGLELCELTLQITRTLWSLPVLQVDDHRQFTSCPLALISAPVRSRQGLSLLLKKYLIISFQKCEAISRILVISWLTKSYTEVFSDSCWHCLG